MAGKFAQTHGHCRIHQLHRAEGYPLGRWVARMRRQWKKGTVLPAQRRACQALPGWSWDARADDFEKGLAVASRFAKRAGHSRVPYPHREGEFALGEWVARCRQRYRLGQLRPEQRKACESLLGWSWDPLEDDFQEGLRLAREYARRFGHANIAAAYRVGNFRLGAWVSRRRAEYKEGRLRREWQRACARLPGWAWHGRIGRPPNPRRRSQGG